MFNEFTQYIDFAQVSLYAFWIFFAGLVYWLRKEDRREGYPLESDNPRRVLGTSNILFASPKTFIRPDGTTYDAPNFARDTRPIASERTAVAEGSTSHPIGDPMLSGVGPASYAQREDHPELMREGAPAIVPMRVATDYSVSAGPDPRGWNVIGADGAVAGTVKDIWVDRADMLVRYLEVALTSGETRLAPITMLVVRPQSEAVELTAVRSEQLAHVPTLKAPDQVTLFEEEKISAFFAGGLLYAEPKRLGPIV